MSTIEPSYIVDHYRRRKALRRRKLPFILSGVTLTNTGTGVGDTLILSDLPRAGANTAVSVFSQSRHFPVLMAHNPFYHPEILPFWVAADRLYLNFDLGNGHLIQRIRRAFGFTPDIVPKGCLDVRKSKMVPGRTIMHFEPGAHSNWQRKVLHPRAREIYPASTKAIITFVRQRKDLEFIEVGERSFGLPGVRSACGVTLDETIRLMATAEFFLGIISGPLHLAAALGLKMINVINFPRPDDIVLPTLKDIDQPEAEWFYPQSVLLHQEGQGGTVARLSAKNLHKAFDGELYPYWSTNYLSLIELVPWKRSILS